MLVGLGFRRGKCSRLRWSFSRGGWGRGLITIELSFASSNVRETAIGYVSMLLLRRKLNHIRRDCVQHCGYGEEILQMHLGIPEE